MSKSSQAFYDATQNYPDSHMPEAEPCFCQLSPLAKNELDRMKFVNEQLDRLFGNPLPF